MTLALSSKALVAELAAELKHKTVSVLSRTGVTPTLAILMAGNSPESASYTRQIEKRGTEAGIRVRVETLPGSISESAFLDALINLNNDSGIHGIIVQSQLPSHIRPTAIYDTISPNKDVDGVSPVNAGRLALGQKNGFVPCTALAALRLLKSHLPDLTGKNIVMIGRSNTVGKPLLHLLLRENATPTICHTKTKNLTLVAKQADVVIAAVGRARMVTADMIGPGATVIDVGINFDSNGKMTGDLDYDAVMAQGHAAAATPVPGGVGPLTNMMLIEQTILACENTQPQLNHESMSNDR